jgi:uncharacterized protein (TIGR02646 family)
MATFHRRKKPPDGKPPGWYKGCLRVDFDCRCAYCLIHERGYQTHESVQIDHFKPRSRFPDLERTYSNLYYSCQLCNKRGRKGDRWPTQAEISGGFRFVDPCAEDWEKHIVFQRTGPVTAVTPAGEYSIDNLGLNRHQLIVHRLKNPAEYHARSLLHKIGGQLNRIATLASETRQDELITIVPQLLENLRKIREEIEKKWDEKRPTYPPPVCRY